MKKLQNNYTTPEQSKRLLELGVPADSADCVHTYLGIKILPEGIVYSNYNWMVADGDNRIPCWSVGQLMNIFDICHIVEQTSKDGWCSYRRLHKNQTYIDYLLFVYKKNKMQELLDFSKLEE